MDRLVVNGNEISEYVDIVTKYIDDFIVIVKEIDKKKDSLVWESDNYDKLIALYDMMIKKYLKYIDRMINLMKFLNNTINRYDDSLLSINNEYKKLESEYGGEIIHG